MSGHSAATGVTASGEMEQKVAMALWLSALVPFNDLKCQGYYWPWPQFWLMAVQMSNPTSVSEPSGPEQDLGSGVATCPGAFLNPAVCKEVAISLNGLPCGLVASLCCLAIIMHHMCLPYVLSIPRDRTLDSGQR